jgi:cell division protein FtsB
LQALRELKAEDDRFNGQVQAQEKRNHQQSETIHAFEAQVAALQKTVETLMAGSIPTRPLPDHQ